MQTERRHFHRMGQAVATVDSRAAFTGVACGETRSWLLALIRRLALVALVASTPTLHAEVPAWTDEPAGLVSLIERANRAHRAGNDLVAARLYCTAAAHGSLEAQFQLARLYLGPLRARRGGDTGHVLLALAAQRGHARAEKLLTSIRKPLPATFDNHLPPCLYASAPLPPADADAVVPHAVVEHYIAGLPRADRAHARLVQRLAPRFKVDARLALAIVRAESNFDPSARSPRNAMGLMQLIPDTAERFGVRDPFDPEQNVRGGLAYLRWLIARYDGDIARVAGAYNAGEGAVDRYGGVPPFAETEEYVQRILGFYRARRHASMR
ncbi:lytic transglycosylase domain-containing protein [Thauera sp. GDN1]|uniref:lytic transglycosylase domain-containing protein n=1 Tax=Thauera sp. GDN1 TaxID=2944810 RepID=UPI00247AEEE7|nr:lytic transglycosylase domain-containing protein [Thauera sp. GDN1]